MCIVYTLCYICTSCIFAEEVCRSENYSYHLIPFLMNREPETVQMCQVPTPIMKVWNLVKCKYNMARVEMRQVF